MPADYHVQNGCHNCRHRFEEIEYDCGNTLHCAHGAPPRPICGSVSMNEMFSWDDNKLYEVQVKAWAEWSAGREVVESGICPHFTKED